VGIFLATVENSYFWCLVDEVDQKSATIAYSLAETIRDLQDRGFTVCSIVTSNASNECVALNPKIATSVQRLTEVPVIRTHCMSHTTDLAVGEFLKSLCSARPVPCDVWKNMIAIRNELSSRWRGTPFHSLPNLCPTGWLLMADFVVIIALCYPEAYSSL
jgi:hypothetical protein